ncbi:MAG TPA: FAD-dependent oxidoreductase [Clostridia bacterium]|nr:FAD-dependent oxidoreductase [Clostridia bacterium]
MDPVRHPSAYGAVGRSDCTDPLAAMTHQWLVELGGNRDAFLDAESIRDELLRLVFGLWDHVKNRCPKERERSRNMMLRWVGIFAGKRETRRLLGDTILTQNDICEDTAFEDAVAFGAWVVDDHYSDGYFHRGKAGHHYDDYTHAAYGKVYRIPLRALYSRNIPNLLMAGRNISATHLAMSNTRVMLTCALMGQAAGTAAALCHRYRKDPRAVAAEHIEAVQELLLEQGAHIPGKPYLSPRNLAARARMASEDPADRPADALLDGYNRAVGHAAHAWQPKGSPPYRLTLTWPEAVEINFVELIFQTRDLAPERFTVAGFRDGVRQFEIQSHGKRVRRETLTLDSPALADTLALALSDPAPLCQVDVRMLDSTELQIARRIQANMKQADRVPVLPWERK